MKRYRGSLRWAATALALAFAPSAATAEPQEVTIVAGPRAALAHRLTQELEAAGIVVRVEPTEPSRDAPALFVVVPEEDGAPIEIWSVKDGAASLVASVASDGPADTRVLRAAELARALASPGPRPPDAVIPPAPAPPSASAPLLSRPAPSLAGTPAFIPWEQQGLYRPDEEVPASADFGVALALGLQAQGVSLQIDASARYWPADRIGIGFFVSAPTTGAFVSSAVGTATVRSALFGLELATAPIARTNPFSLVLSPGFALDYLHVSADAEPPLESLGGGALLGAGYGRAEARIAVAGPVRITIGAIGGAAFPPVDITFAGTVYTTYSPFGSASLGVMLEP